MAARVADRRHSRRLREQVDETENGEHGERGHPAADVQTEPRAEPTLPVRLGASRDGSAVGGGNGHRQDTDEPIEAAADHERQRPEETVDADPVDRRAGRAEARKLEDENLCCRGEQHRPAGSQDQSGGESDENTRDQECERLSRGDRPAWHHQTDTKAGEGRERRHGGVPVPRTRLRQQAAQGTRGVSDASR